MQFIMRICRNTCLINLWQGSSINIIPYEVDILNILLNRPNDRTWEKTTFNSIFIALLEQKTSINKTIAQLFTAIVETLVYSCINSYMQLNVHTCTNSCLISRSVGASIKCERKYEICMPSKTNSRISALKYWHSVSWKSERKTQTRVTREDSNLPLICTLSLSIPHYRWIYS